MHVSDILAAKGDRVVSVAPTLGVSEVAGLLRRENIGAVLVNDENGAMAGILSERDIVDGLAKHGRAVLDMPVADLMTRSVVTCQPDSNTEEIMEQILTSRIRHLPVMENGSLVGFISVADVVKAVLSQLRWMTKVLQDHVVTAAAWSTDEEGPDEPET